VREDSGKRALQRNIFVYTYEYYSEIESFRAAHWSLPEQAAGM